MAQPGFHIGLLNPLYVIRNRHHIRRDLRPWVNRQLARIRGMGVTCHLPLTGDDRALMRLRDVHRGKRAFLVGNGPSVRMEDLERLKGEIAFCCNRFHLAYDKTSFRPTYTVSADRQMITDFGQEMVDQSEGMVFLADERRPLLPGRFTWLGLNDGEVVLGDEFPFFMAHGGATLVVALQVGWFMGIRDFVLYGVDHHFQYQLAKDGGDVLHAAQGDGNHFIPNYRSGLGWCPPAVEKIEASWKYCRQVLEKSGGSLVNATRGGKLELLPRVSLDEILSK